MEHRGTARRRFVIAHATGRLPGRRRRGDRRRQGARSHWLVRRRQRAGARPARPGEGGHGCRHADHWPARRRSPSRSPAGRPSAGRRQSIRTDRRTGNRRNWRWKRRNRQTMPKKDTSPRAWQRMLSGRRLDLLDPSPLDIEIEDIAHGLARVARWNGQTMGRTPSRSPSTRWWWRRSSGCWRRRSAPRGRLAAMLHDAPEYVIGDLISPFKAVLGGEYPAVEHAAAFRDPPALRLAVAAARGADRPDQGGRPRRGLLRGHGAGRLRRGGGARAFSAVRAQIDPAGSTHALAGGPGRAAIPASASRCWRRPRGRDRDQSPVTAKGYRLPGQSRNRTLHAGRSSSAPSPRSPPPLPPPAPAT